MIASPTYLLALAFLASASDDRALLTPCAQPDLPSEARCATVEVFEDRAAGSGRRIPLAVVVLPATGSPRAADAVFFISGGPGQAATRSAAEVAEEHKATRATRDIVFVDQRGTGGSNALPCVPFPATDIRLYLSEPGPEEIRRCRDTLSAKADLRLYSTEAAVADLEDVRRALGYERVTLDAGSYGTKVALRYLARFPERVRAAVLRAVNPPGFRIPLPFAAAGQTALDRLIDDCGRDGACRAAFPDVRGDLVKALARLDAGPVPVRVINPGTGKVEAATLDRRTFVARLHLLLFASRLANRIPLLLHTAAGSDFSPFAELAAAFGKAIADQIDWGMQLSVLCTEDLPLISREEAEREAHGTFLGPGLIFDAQAQCADWPRGTLPRDFGEPMRSDVPVLLVSGGVDPATPARYAEDAARTLSRSRHVVVPSGSHMDGGDCVNAIASAFITAGTTDALDTSCVNDIRRPEWVLAAPGASAPETDPAVLARARVMIRTDLGAILIEVDAARAPVTAANFLRYVDGGFYEGGRFHRTVHASNQPGRAVKIDVVQAGINPSREAAGFPPIVLERTSATGLRHLDGVISMARDGPDTATSDFFICIGDQPALDAGGRRNPDGQGFAAFGRVVQGMDVVRRIQGSPADGQHLTPPVVIRSARRAP